MNRSFAFVVLMNCICGLKINIRREREEGNDNWLSFVISNQCDKLNTTSIVFKIPQEVVNVKAHPLPGFIITSTTRPVDPPCLLYEVEVNETIDTLTFTGILTKVEIQVVSLSMQLRETNWFFRHLKFEIIQRCGDEYNIDWVADDSSDEYPAPTTTIITLLPLLLALSLIVLAYCCGVYIFELILARRKLRNKNDIEKKPIELFGRSNHSLN